MVRVRWTGAAGLEIIHDNKTWLIDPYYSRWGKLKVFLGQVEPRKDEIHRRMADLPGALQAVIVGHTHFDHALDVPEIASRFDGPVIGSRSLDTLIETYGMQGRVTVCRGGERLDLPGGAVVTMVPSRHVRGFMGKVPYAGEIEPGDSPPRKAALYRQGKSFICLFEVGGVTFAHSGSADFIDEALSGLTCDVLFMTQPFWHHTKDYHRRLLGRLKPRVVVPFHFDDFMKPLGPDGTAPSLPSWLIRWDDFLDRLHRAAGDAEVMVPKTYQTLEF